MKKQVAGTKNISDFKICHDPSSRGRNQTKKKCKGLNDDDPTVMQISAVPHSEVLVVHEQNGLPRNTQGSNQIQDVNAPT